MKKQPIEQQSPHTLTQPSMLQQLQLPFVSGYRIGNGFDVHRLVSGRRLILGGIEVAFDKGLDGHSDADVLVHAVMDSLLSAAGLQDIGVHFPDTDTQYKGISSITLLQHVCKLVRQNEYVIVNVTAVVAAQQPRLATVIPQMRTNLASVIGIEANNVNISATTTEELGVVGQQQAMAAYAVSLLQVAN